MVRLVFSITLTSVLLPIVMGIAGVFVLDDYYGFEYQYAFAILSFPIILLLGLPWAWTIRRYQLVGFWQVTILATFMATLPVTLYCLSLLGFEWLRLGAFPFDYVRLEIKNFVVLELLVGGLGMFTGIVVWTFGVRGNKWFEQRK